jgi:hypothetical protein
MPQPQQAKSSNKDGRLLLAIEAIKNGQIQSIRDGAEYFDVSSTTLACQINGRPQRRDCTPNSRKLTPYEEEAIVQYILDLDLRGFPPRPRDVQEMADLLLAERDASLLARTGPQTLPTAVQRSNQCSIANTTTRELNAKIQ